MRRDREDRDRDRAELPGAFRRRDGDPEQDRPFPNLARAVDLPAPKEGGERRGAAPKATVAGSKPRAAQPSLQRDPEEQDQPRVAVGAEQFERGRRARAFDPGEVATRDARQKPAQPSSAR